MSRAATALLLALLALAPPAARAEDALDALYEEARATLDHHARAAREERARAEAEGSAWSDGATDGCYAAQSGEAARRERDASEGAEEAGNGTDARLAALVHVAGNLSRGEGAGPGDVADALDLPRPPSLSEARNATDEAVLDAVAAAVVLLGLPQATACATRGGPSNHTRALAREDVPAATRIADNRTGADATGAYLLALQAAEETAGAAGVDPYEPLVPPDVTWLLDPVFEALAQAECDLLGVCPEASP